MTYDEALEYVHGTLKFGIKLGLENIKILLSLLGDPHKKLKYVHVAGTNGKGSTVAFIASILKTARYKTGSYISPFIIRFNERIQVDGFDISDEDFARSTKIVKEKIRIMCEMGHNHPTEFEIITAIAFLYFTEKNCDIVVLETGLGGRFDSTNVIDCPEVAVITSISYDHMDRLGDTLEKIAFEKAGIIKNNSSVVLYHQERNVEEVFEKVCNDTGSQIIKVNFDNMILKDFNQLGQTFDFNSYKDLHISLIGDHQVNNAVTAINTCEVLRNKGFHKITKETIYKGLDLTKWPGRMELINEKPLFFIDGAHNEDGAWALKRTLDKYFPDKSKIFIIGVLKDKNYEEVVKHLAGEAKLIITITPNSPRALDTKELSGVVLKYNPNVLLQDNIEDAIKVAINNVGEDDIICAFGSLYYIGEVRKYFD